MCDFMKPVFLMLVLIDNALLTQILVLNFVIVQIVALLCLAVFQICYRLLLLRTLSKPSPSHQTEIDISAPDPVPIDCPPLPSILSLSIPVPIPTGHSMLTRGKVGIFKSKAYMLKHLGLPLDFFRLSLSFMSLKVSSLL